MLAKWASKIVFFKPSTRREQNWFSDDSQDDAESSSAEILKDLKLSIRCLSLTTCYFVSQLCTFLPGVLLFGCDLKSSSSDVTDVSLQHQIPSLKNFTNELYLAS